MKKLEGKVLKSIFFQSFFFNLKFFYYRLSRQAEKFIKRGKYQEAIEAHQQIVKYLK